MKTLYESILGSTKAGAVSMIDTWWKSFKDSDLYGNYSVQKIGNKFYIIIDDFSRMSHQHSIHFEHDDLDKLPKHLGGVCWTDYRSKQGEKSVRPCNINITNVFNKKIDLSGWDFSHWNISIGDVPVRIMFCRGIDLFGLPKYKTEFNVTIERTDIKKFELDNPNAMVEISDCELFSIDFIKNTTLRKLHFDYKSITNVGMVEWMYDKTPRRFVFTDSISKKIERLIKENDIKEVRYRATKDDLKPLTQYTSYPFEKVGDRYTIPKSPK